MVTGRVVMFVQIMAWIWRVSYKGNFGREKKDKDPLPPSIWIVASFTDTTNATESIQKMKLEFHDA